MKWVKFTRWINYIAGASISVFVGFLVIVILTGGNYWNWGISFFGVPLGLLAGAISNRQIKNNERIDFLVGSFFWTIFRSIVLTIFGWFIYLLLKDLI